MVIWVGIEIRFAPNPCRPLEANFSESWGPCGLVLRPHALPKVFSKLSMDFAAHPLE